MLTFRVLGSFEVEHEGKVAELAGRRQRDVLAVLLVNANHVVSTDRLIDELWGDQPPPTAATSLHNTISQLRRLLGDDTIVTRTPGYVVPVAADALDATRFEQLLTVARGAEPAERARLLQEGLALWRGRAFEDVGDWPVVQAEARRLEELRVVAHEDLFDAKLELGAN